jgi:rod shape-determining protein MreC
MVAIPSRHKSLVLLAAVVLAQILALAVQIKARNSQGDRESLIRGWTVGAVSPFERAGAWMAEKVSGAWRHYFALSETAKENDRLRQENDDLKLQLNELRSKADEAGRLAALLHFREEHEKVQMIPARVIGTSADASSQVVYVDRGARDGLRRNMGVITPDGVVGKVLEVYRHTAQVLLLTDRDSGVGAMLADTRIQGPVGGTGEPLLDMRYVASDDQVKTGERVVTSGMDRIFPKDLPVGTVVQVKPGTTFKSIKVQPSANLERLEEVLILPTLEPLETKPVASADAEEPAPRTASKTEGDSAKTNGERIKAKMPKAAESHAPKEAVEKAKGAAAAVNHPAKETPEKAKNAPTTPENPAPNQTIQKATNTPATAVNHSAKETPEKAKTAPTKPENPAPKQTIQKATNTPTTPDHPR